MKKLSALKERFSKLAVLGDLQLILESSKRTYMQQKQIAALVDKDKADKFQAIIDTLDEFLSALEESEKTAENNILRQITGIKEAAILKTKEVFKHTDIMI